MIHTLFLEVPGRRHSMGSRQRFRGFGSSRAAHGCHRDGMAVLNVRLRERRGLAGSNNTPLFVRSNYFHLASDHAHFRLGSCCKMHPTEPHRRVKETTMICVVCNETVVLELVHSLRQSSTLLPGMSFLLRCTPCATSPWERLTLINLMNCFAWIIRDDQTHRE